MDTHRILVIDDSKEIVRYLTKQVLPTFGFETLAAADGATGLRLIRSERPDLVMLDLNLPELNGLDVLRALAREAVAVPVILMTGYGSEKDAIEAFRLGIRDYLVKPFTVDEVIETINKVLDEEKKRYGNSEQLAEDVRRLKTDISRLINETNTLFSIGKAVASLLDVHKVVERVLDAAIYLTNAEESTIWVHDADSNELRAFAKKGHDKKLLPVNVEKRDSVAAEVMREGRPIRKMAFSGGGIKIQTGFLARAVLYVPLTVRGITLGVLSVSNLRAPRPFTERHEFLLSVLGDYAAIALENSRTFQAADRALALGMDELKTINQITRTITSQIDLREVVKQTLRQVHNSWKIDAASLWLFDEQSQTTRVLTNVGTEDADILTRLEIPVAKGFIGHVIRTGKWIYTNEVNNHPLHYKEVDIETGFTTDSLLCVPLIFREKVMGAMQLINKQDGPFDERDVERARSIGSAVAIALSNALLFEQGETRLGQLEATLEHVDTPTLIISRDGRLILMNQNARNILKTNPNAMGQHINRVIKQPRLVSLIESATSETSLEEVALTDGSTWMVTIAPVENEEGHIVMLEPVDSLSKNGLVNAETLMKSLQAAQAHADALAATCLPEQGQDIYKLRQAIKALEKQIARLSGESLATETA